MYRYNISSARSLSDFCYNCRLTVKRSITEYNWQWQPTQPRNTLNIIVQFSEVHVEREMVFSLWHTKINGQGESKTCINDQFHISLFLNRNRHITRWPKTPFEMIPKYDHSSFKEKKNSFQEEIFIESEIWSGQFAWYRIPLSLLFKFDWYSSSKYQSHRNWKYLEFVNSSLQFTLTNNYWIKCDLSSSH